ncbi:hypothetical protein P691DRAFT_808718 [Macrolepiota fuliginosa MF-IS2]|uniref:Uncharacterized protein n=1 Tax=Macrolepiota fuliginosa MF-IS2 TaxID=1400762 RepID=A0A9P5X577_9AGAR|nr:hypothetical protein P691DRAFT_808718 [Macrolepiota fuliginosa MF-IS2]
MQLGDVPTLGDADSPLITFLFIGSNTTLSKHVALNLEDVPTNFIPAISNSTIGNTTSPALVSALVCDPQLQIQPTTAILSGGSLRTEVTTHPSINNIPLAAANAIFSQSLLEATSTRESYTDQSIVNAIARILFLTDPSFSHDDKPAGIKPLSLDQINEKMDTVLLSYFHLSR